MVDKIETAIETTIQDGIKRDVYGGISLVRWSTKTGMYVSPWWSEQRDVDLRNFWKRSDHLSGAVYTMTSKISSIPFKVVPRDIGNKENYNKAIRMTEELESVPEFGGGWQGFITKFIEDYLTQDNGAFAEVIGAGRPDGPLIGRPVSIAHLDSSRCQRTGNAEYPVLYRSAQGKLHKLHFTRVMFASQMTSPIEDMFGVGFCAVSRCVGVAQTLMDIIQFKQEKLGSRPHRAILIPQGGMDPADIASAFELAESAMDSQGLSRYSKVVLAGSSSMPEADLKMVELSQLPEGFDEQTSITLGMATIALAFGVDARELFPAMTAGATRADALLQHLKQRGKGPGQILAMLEQIFAYKYLPKDMRLIFDFQDDAQDRQEAEISEIRANKRVQDITSGSVDLRTTRELMMADLEITRRQFERLELSDGRLPDGAPVVALFYRHDKEYKDWLNVGTDDPLDRKSNDQEAMLEIIRERIAQVSMALVTSPPNSVTVDRAMEALAALSKLDEFYRMPEETPIGAILGVFSTAPQEEESGNGNRIDERVRTTDLTTPKEDNETDSRDSIRAHPDDKPQ